MNTTIWFGGNKEFHDDLRSLTDNARNKLYLIQLTGSRTLEKFKKRMNIMNYQNIGIVYRKIIELEEILNYADIPSFLDVLKGSTTPTSKSLSSALHTNQIETIEKVYRDELTFLFYLNLNTTLFTSNKADFSKMQGQLIPDFQQRQAEYEEAVRLGSPKQRLMAILTKDKDIKQWFFEWVNDIMNYRKQTSDKMSEFYDQVIKSHENVRRQHHQIKEPDEEADEEAIIEILHEE